MSIPHFINGDLVVAIDFAAQAVLVADLYKKGEAKSGRSKHMRLSLVDGQWRRDMPPRHSLACPSIDAESYRWLTDRQPVADVHITPERAPVVVDRRALASTLERLGKITGRSLADDGLLTVHVHVGGVSLVSHGGAQVVAEIKHAVDTPPRDGLGSIVVLAEALRAHVKEMSNERVQVSVDPRATGRRLHVAYASLWSVDTKPRHLAAAETQAFGISHAIVRALQYASADEARVNLNCVAILRNGSHVRVEATDGHRLYREFVLSDSPRLAEQIAAIPERLYTIPRAVLATLRKGKRAGNYTFAFDGAVVTVACDGLSVVCRPSGHTYPPSDQIVPAWLSALARGEAEPGYSAELKTLSQADAAALARWVKKHADHDETVYLQFAREPFGLRVYTKDTSEGMFGATEFEPIAGTRNEDGTRAEATAYNKIRGLRAGYLLDFLATFADAEAVQWSFVRGDLDPIYFITPGRVGVLMTVRV